MSTKNSSYVAAAAVALGVVVLAGASPICEGLLNDLNITSFGGVEVDASGRAVVIVSVFDGTDTVVRPVADSMGNVRLYGDAAAVMSLAKRANISAGTTIKMIKFVKTATVGDPIAALKSKYKSFKSEVTLATKQLAAVSTKVTAGEALGWDTALGTPENAEYLDLVARVDSIEEWKDYSAARVTALAANLTTAGIDPATVV